MKPSLIDTHCHLVDPQFADDLEAVLDRARAAGVVAIVAVATDVEDSRSVLALAERHPDVWAAVGVHPNECAGATDETWRAIEGLAQHPKVVAIGESGLDYYRDRATPEQQLGALRRQAEIAQRRNLPIIIHNREADVDLARELGELYRGAPGDARSGVLHCYASDPALALGLLGAGFRVSFGGNLSFKKAEAIRAAAAALPLDRILLETDAPYLSPEPLRGRRNEPAHVAHTARRLAEVRGIDPADLAAVTATNAAALFGARLRGRAGETRAAG